MRLFSKYLFLFWIFLTPLVSYAQSSNTFTFSVYFSTPSSTDQYVSILRPGKGRGSTTGNNFTACDSGYMPSPGPAIPPKVVLSVKVPARTGTAVIAHFTDIGLTDEDDVCIRIGPSLSDYRYNYTLSGIYKVKDILDSAQPSNPTMTLTYHGFDSKRQPYPAASSFLFDFARSTPAYFIKVIFKGDKAIHFYQPYVNNSCYAIVDDYYQKFGGEAGPYINPNKDEETYPAVPLSLRPNMENPEDKYLSFCYQVYANSKDEIYGPYKVWPQDVFVNNIIGEIIIKETSDTCFVSYDAPNAPAQCEPYSPN
jgi:hypothetical protein